MKLIKPSFEILEQKDLFEHIERCGRIAYKSEDRITKDSAKPFVDMLIKKGHTAVLEHGTVYLYFKYTHPVKKDYLEKTTIEQIFRRNKYSYVASQIKDFHEHHIYITTNYRVIIENDLQDVLQYQCDPMDLHVKRYTVKFICDRGISHELVRHRIFCVA